MNKMKNGWKKLIVLLLLMPIVVFFPACSCSEGSSSGPQLNPKDNTYTVHFFTNTDETFNIPNQYKLYGELVDEPEMPTRYGYAFIGWYTDENFTRVWLFESDVVTQTITLYARWDKRI